MEEELRRLLTERENTTKRIQRQEYFMNRQLEDMEKDFKSYMPNPTAVQERQFKQLRDEYKESAEKEINETKHSLDTIEGRIGLELRKIRDGLLREEGTLKKNIEDAKKKLEDAEKEAGEAQVRKLQAFRKNGEVIDDSKEEAAAEIAKKEFENAEKALKAHNSRIEQINQFFGTIKVKDTPSDKILEMLGYKEAAIDPKEEPAKPESAVEPKDEPVAEPAKPEPVVEPKAEPVEESEKEESLVDFLAKNGINLEPAAEPVKQDPVVEPKAEPVAEPVKPEPAVEPKAEPVAEPAKPEPVVEPKAEPVAEPVKPEPVMEPKAKPVAEPVKIERVLPKNKPEIEPEKDEENDLFFNWEDMAAENRKHIEHIPMASEAKIELVSVETDLSKGCVSCVYNINGKRVVVPTNYVDEEHESVIKPKELIKAHEDEDEYYVDGTDPYVLYAIYESARGLNNLGYIDEEKIIGIQDDGIEKYNQALKTTEKDYLNAIKITYGKSDVTCDKNMLKYEKKYIRRAKVSSCVDFSAVKDDVKTIFEKAKDFFASLTSKAPKLPSGDKKLEQPESEKEDPSKKNEENIQGMKEKLKVYSKESNGKEMSKIHESLSKDLNARDVASRQAQNVARQMNDDEGR